jgi:hypothetical protein
MKGVVGRMAGDEWGHVVLAMALACVDDTALTGKVLGSEIKVRCGSAWGRCGSGTTRAIWAGGDGREGEHGSTARERGDGSLTIVHVDGRSEPLDECRQLSARKGVSESLPPALHGTVHSLPEAGAANEHGTARARCL